MTTAKSAYPVAVEDLLPQARALADRLGAVPSRNQLMSEFRIGARKANTILTYLSGEEHHTTEPRRSTEPGAGLRVVPGPHADSAGSQADSTGPEHGVEPSGVEPGVDPGDEARESAGAATVRVTGGVNPDTGPRVVSGRGVRSWPVLLLALPAFVAIWSGWVGLGELTGFGTVHLLPGIADEFALNTAITLPIGVETYAAYALRVWLSGRVPARARTFAQYSALGSLALGALGQITYHLMTATGTTIAPWPITTAVSCLPVAVLGMGAALTHLLHDTTEDPEVTR